MRWSRLWPQLRHDWVMQGIVVLALVLIIVAIVVPLVLPDPSVGNISNRLSPPSWLGGNGGIFGADGLGRPLATRVVHGLQTTYIVGVSSVFLGFCLGSVLGLVSGYFGGWVDMLIMRIVDLQLSMPGILIIMVIMVVTDGSLGMLVLALGLTTWTMFARVGRSNVLRLRSSDFVMATQSLGAGPVRVMARHLLPNVLGQLVAVGTLEFARVMLAEASLSFLGFGVQLPRISLGAIMSGGREYLASQWWITVFSGLALALVVLTANLIGSWLLRALDPRSSSVAFTGPLETTLGQRVS